MHISIKNTSNRENVPKAAQKVTHTSAVQNAPRNGL